MKGFDENGGTPVTDFNNLCPYYGGRESEFFIFQRQKHENWKPVFTEKN